MDRETMASKNTGEHWTTIHAITEPDIRSAQVMDIYKTWATSYDDHMSKIPFLSFDVMAEIACSLLGDKKDALILDAGAGTGLVGKRLTECGFTNIDALDGSQGMLDVAMEKGMYKKYICAMLGAEKLAIPKGHYASTISVGTIVPGHATAACLPELIRITKPGGYVIIASREVHFPHVGHQGKSFDDWVQILEDNGSWRKIEKRRVENYQSDYAGLVYVYQVL